MYLDLLVYYSELCFSEFIVSLVKVNCPSIKFKIDY